MLHLSLYRDQGDCYFGVVSLDEHSDSDFLVRRSWLGGTAQLFHLVSECYPKVVFLDMTSQVVEKQSNRSTWAIYRVAEATMPLITLL